MSQKINTARYNAIQTKVNDLLGIGTNGYGQQVKSIQLPDPAPANTTIKAIEVNNLVADLRKILIHQDGGLHEDIKYVVAKETKISNDDFNNFETWITTAQLESRRWNLPASQSIESNALQSIRSLGWNNEIVHEVSFNFTQSINARYFFNAGGSITLSTAMSGASPTDAKSTAWATLLNTIRAVVINHDSTVCPDGVGTGSAKGFYNLNSNYQDIYTATCAAPYTSNKYTIAAKQSGQFVYVKATFTDGDTGGVNNDNLVSGTITSSVKYRIAASSSTNGTNNFTLTAPQMLTQTGLDSSGISQSYSVALSPSPAYEGSNLIVDIKTYPAVSTVWYEITGPGVGTTRFTQTSALVHLSNGNSTLTIPINVDLGTGSSKIIVSLWDNNPTQPSANKLATSNEIIIGDTPIDIHLAITTPSNAILNETDITSGAFAITSTGLPQGAVFATVTATGTGASLLTLPTNPITITNGVGGFVISVNADYKNTGPLQADILVSVGSLPSNTVQVTINDTSKPVIVYHTTKEPNLSNDPTKGITAYTYDTNLYYTITGGKKDCDFKFTRGTDAPLTRTLSSTGTFPHGGANNIFTGILTPGTLPIKITFTGDSHVYTQDITFTDEVQEILISPVSPDILADGTLFTIDFALSHCYTPKVIHWEFDTPPIGVYKYQPDPLKSQTEVSGDITVDGTNNAGVGSGSLVLHAVSSTPLFKKGTSFTVKFTLSTLTTINATTRAIRIIDAFPYTTNVDAQVFLPTLASAVTIKARGGAGGGGGKDGGGIGGNGSSANTIVTKEPVGSVRTLSTVIGKGGNPGLSDTGSLGGGLGGVGYKHGGNGGDVRNDNYSGGGGAGGGATAVLADTSVLVVAGGAGGGGGGSDWAIASGSSAIETNTLITTFTGTDGITGDGGGSGDGGGAGGSGGFVTTIGTNLKGADHTRSATAGTSGNIAYDNSQPVVTGTPFLINTNTGGLGTTAKATGTAGADGEVTIYVQPMAPQYPVAELHPGLSGAEEYYINADAPLKDGSAPVVNYTVTGSSPANGIISDTGALPMTDFTFTTGQRAAFKIAANNVFGKGVEIAVPVQTFKITDITKPGINIGISVAMSGDGNYLVVGAPYANTKGCAYVYQRSGNVWIQSDILFGFDTVSGDRFGYSVDISYDGSRVIVGSPDKAYIVGGTSYPKTGAAHIFLRLPSGKYLEEVFLESGNSDHDLTPIDKPNDFFGAAVKISSDGTMVLIGAYGDDSGSTYSIGYIWHYYINSTTNSWAGVSGTTGSNYLPTGASEAQALHGSSLAISSNMLVCAEGAPGDNNKGWFASVSVDLDNAGTVCLFKRSSTAAKTWSPLKTYLYSPTPIADGKFGTSIALNSTGTILVVGAPGESAFGLAKAGVVHVFVGSGTTWAIQEKLMASDAQAGANFGTSVTINDAGTTILVGANNATAGIRTGSGIVYKFVKTGTTWIQDAIITPYDKAETDSFGTSVSLNSTGDLAVIGAPNTDPTKAGAAYTFQLGSYVADDPYWANVMLLINADGMSVNATDFVDKSNYSSPLTIAGNSGATDYLVCNTAIKPSTAGSTGSIKFGGANNTIGAGTYIGLTAPLVLSKTAWTMEAWIHPVYLYNSGTDHNSIFIWGSELELWLMHNGQVGVTYNSSPWSGPYSGPGDIKVLINEWSHIAAVYNGTSISIYVNGVLWGTKTGVTNFNNTANNMGIGSHIGGNSEVFRGYMNDLRITNGVARYTGATHPVPTKTFTPTFTFQP